ANINLSSTVCGNVVGLVKSKLTNMDAKLAGMLGNILDSVAKDGISAQFPVNQTTTFEISDKIVMTPIVK
ncbi:MAG: hypothetical protein RR374_05435, partial [Clostridia bacterium]